MLTEVQKVRQKNSIYCVILLNSKIGTSPVVKNLPANAEDTGLIPGLGTKIPHVAGQLNFVWGN